MMQMLGAAGVPLLCDTDRGADADNPRGYFEYAPVKSTLRDASWLEEAGGHAVKVVAPLLARLPVGREFDVLLMRRALPEVLASQGIMLERAGAANDGLSDARMSEILAAQWREAEAWCQRAARSLVVDHAELLQTPEAVCQRVCAFLQRPSAAAAMALCVEPGLHRQRADS
jgi:hypothetical protein